MDESVQDITDGLMPMNLKQYGINNALRDLVMQRQGTAGIRITIDDEAVILEESRSLHVYRIIQECVNNAIKHSQATQLNISLHIKQGNIVLGVRDDGTGFKTEAGRGRKPGLGLDTIYNRIRFLKGELFLNSMNGCEWIFFVPIK